MSLEVEYTCPLGSECETVKGKKIVRCSWYTKVAGVNAEDKEVDDWSCAISWMPMLQIEMSSTNRGQTSALESFRNEMVQGQDEFNNLVSKRINLTG